MSMLRLILQNYQTLQLRLVLVIGVAAFSQIVLADTTKQGQWQLSTYQQTNNLAWGISALGGSPNIVSELQWQQVSLPVFQINWRSPTNSQSHKGWHWQAGLLLGDGALFDGAKGSVIDSDYNGDNKSQLFSQSVSNIYNSEQQGWHAQWHYQWATSVGKQQITINPFVGWQSQQMDMAFHQGQQTVCDASGSPRQCTIGVGDIAGLNSHYNTHWQGTQAGLLLHWQASPQWSFEASFANQLGDYEATMDWNLRADLQHPVSLSQQAIYQGQQWHLATNWHISPNQQLSVIYQTQQFNLAGQGKHTFHFTSGDVRVDMSHLYWQSQATGIEWRYLY